MGQHLKVTNYKVLKSISKCNYPERLHCKYPGRSRIIRVGREGRREGRMGGSDGRDGNYEVGAYGMEWVRNRQPERSRLTS